MPDVIRLVFLPPYSPDQNPFEHIWLYRREHFLSHYLFDWPTGHRPVLRRPEPPPAKQGRIASLTDHLFGKGFLARV